MIRNEDLKDYLSRHVLAKVQTPAQYIGGEPNRLVKPSTSAQGRLCLAFPDTYTIGMSHHGLQILYSQMNALDDWVCEQAFTPFPDMEAQLREHGLPLYSLDTFSPLCDFDVLGFSLQYELCSINLLTMLDLGKIPLHGEARTMADPLIIAGGPCAQNPEPLAKFVDVFVSGDGEPSLPEICALWKKCRDAAKVNGQDVTGPEGVELREEAIAELAKALPYAYCPRFYKPEYADGRFAKLQPTRGDVPTSVQPAIIRDLEGLPIPTQPIVPYIETVHDRIAIEIMRGCPWQCRFCQSSVIKRPLRIRSVETIVNAAKQAYENTGFNEISLLSLSSSDYPHFKELIIKLRETFNPLGVNISIPSLRVNDQLRTIAELIGNTRRSSLTLAPEVARDDMRTQIRKKIKNEDLYEGCRQAFSRNFESVKLYFMVGLPGEREVDLDGIIEMAETISKIGKEVRGRYANVTASVSNFVPKSHTPYQWNGMQRREYFEWAQHYLRRRCHLRSVTVKCHHIETSLLEGVISRGDRRTGEAIELAWQRGARLDSWTDHFNAERWWTALEDCGIDVETQLHKPFAVDDTLPWDHVNVKSGRAFLEKEQTRSLVQLETMAEAT